MNESSREKHANPPMRGKEVASMFGDGKLLELESQQEQMKIDLEKLSGAILEAQSQTQGTEPTLVEFLEKEQIEKRHALQELDRKIKKIATDFAEKRGPITHK